jgi:hypothetical protein
MSCSSQGYEGLTCYICERPAPAGKCGTCSKSSDCGENLWCDTNDMKCHSISEVHTCEDE